MILLLKHARRLALALGLAAFFALGAAAGGGPDGAVCWESEGANSSDTVCEGLMLPNQVVFWLGPLLLACAVALFVGAPALRRAAATHRYFAIYVAVLQDLLLRMDVAGAGAVPAESAERAWLAHERAASVAFERVSSVIRPKQNRRMAMSLAEDAVAGLAVGYLARCVAARADVSAADAFLALAPRLAGRLSRAWSHLDELFRTGGR